jgi:hypothetical protein
MGVEIGIKRETNHLSLQHKVVENANRIREEM